MRSDHASDGVPPAIFAFDGYEVDEGLLELRREGRVVPIEPKPFRLLLHLLKHRDRIVSSDELVAEVWPDAHVTRSSLGTALYQLRRALGDAEAEAPRIATARGRGYRFVGRVAVQTGAATPPTGESESTPELLPELREALAAAESGDRRVVLLHGPPGIGKTHALMDTARAATARGFEVQLGRAYEGDGAPPFWPWIQILRGLIVTHDADALERAAGHGATELVQLVPELETHLPAPPRGETLPGAADRFRLFDGIVGFLTRLTERRPLLIALDDLHWADEASLELLVFLTRGVRRAPLALIGTHRELALDTGRSQARMVARVLREPQTTSVPLVGLERDSVLRLLRGALTAEPDDGLVERVHSTTAGNPFFVVELTRILARAEAAGEELLPAQIPLRLQDAVRVRIAECSEPCQELLRVAAVLGPRLELGPLRRALHALGPAVVDALDEAERRRLIVAHGAHEYRFAHALVRETLYCELGTGERLRLHREIALALEESEATQPQRVAELAYHYAEAAPLVGAEKAVLYARKAAQHASRVSAHDAAVAHQRRALEALDHLDSPEPELRCALLLELGAALSLAHEPIEGVEEVFSHALQLARTLGRPDLMARAAIGITSYFDGKDTLALLRPPRARTLLDRLGPTLEHAAEALTGPEQSELCARSLLALAALHDAAGIGDTARPLIERALSSASAKAEPALRAEALLRQWILHPTLDRVAERLGLAHDALALARAAGRTDLETTAQSILAFMALERADRDAIDATAREIDALVDSRVPEARSAAGVLSCLRAQLDGDLDAAERAITDGVAIAARLNYTHPRTQIMQAVQGWWLAVLRGRARSTVSLWETFVTFDPGLRLPQFFLARLYAELGLDRELEPLYASLISKQLWAMPRDDHWLFCASSCAEICSRIGDAASADRLIDALEPYADRSITAAWLLFCTGSVARPLGSLHALRGRWAQAEQRFTEAYAHAQALRSPLLAAWTQLEQGRALRAHPSASERSRADELLESAGAWASPRGARFQRG